MSRPTKPFFPSNPPKFRCGTKSSLISTIICPLKEGGKANVALFLKEGFAPPEDEGEDVENGAEEY